MMCKNNILGSVQLLIPLDNCDECAIYYHVDTTVHVTLFNSRFIV